MSYREEVVRVLKEVEGNVQDASYIILNGAAKIALYTIQLGLEKVKAQGRRENRREIKHEIQPTFVKGRAGSIQLSKASKQRLLENTQRLFSDEGWMIGDINIGVMTKEQLISQAIAERKSAKGSIQNAQFYEALAEPLLPGQKVSEYWKPKAASRIKRDISKGAGQRLGLR